MFEIFKIKNIPQKSWSSEKPLNFKPKVSTFLLLCIGLAIFGLGEGLLLVSTTGNSPWSVLAEGIETKEDLMLAKRMGVELGQGYFLGKPEII